MTQPIGNAPYRRGVVDLEAGGRSVRALVDTAGTSLCVSQALVDELGLTVHEWIDGPGGVPVAAVDPPPLVAGNAELDTEGVVAYAFDDVRALGLAARRADVLLPASVLRRHQVVLDDPAGTMQIGPPGSLERRGVAVPVTVDGTTGVLSTSVEVEDGVVDLLIDTAIGCCLAVDPVMRAWQRSHPDWPASASAVGPANVTGLAIEARVPMLRVPLVQWGSFSIPDVAFAWRAEGVAASGSIGGNVLQLFRLDLDWSAGSVRVEQGASFAGDDAELVGVVVGIDDDGSYVITATVSGLEAVRPGDQLLRVDGQDVAGRPLPDVLDLLRGTAGDRHRLSIARDGEFLDVDAPVLRLLA